MGEEVSALGPRQIQLLEAWAETVETTASTGHYDFTAPTRTDRLTDCVDQFLNDPSEESFTAIWAIDLLRDAVYANAGSIVADWDGDIDDIASFVGAVRDAETYDPAWERLVEPHIVPGLWELYGRLSPESRPIINTCVKRTLPDFGIQTPQTHADGVKSVAAFRDHYEAHAGHATAGADHEVPLHDELEQFLYVSETLDEAELRATLDMADPVYQSFDGWDAARAHGGPIELRDLAPVLDAFALGAGDEAYERGATFEHWGANHWETWKDDYLNHLDATVFRSIDPTALTGETVDAFLDGLAVAEPLSNVIPTYLLGGRWQPWDSLETITAAAPGEAAAVLSRLLTEDGTSLVKRLRAFDAFYRETADSGSERMSLATLLLMIVHPDRYVLYRYSMFKEFFSAFSDYDMPTGFNPSDYVLMNQALEGVRADLATTVDQDVRMIDVHSLLWVFHREGHPRPGY